MNNKLLTILALFAGVFYAGNVSAQFGWGTTTEKPKTEAIKTADQNMNATNHDMMMTPADKTARDTAGDTTSPDAALAPATGVTPDTTVPPAADVKTEIKKDSDMMHKNDMTPAPYEKSDMMAPAAGKSCQ